MKKARITLGLFLILILLLSACERLPFEIPWLINTTPAATLSPEEIADKTPTPVITAAEETTPEPITSLTLWVPPEMDPELDSEASQIFKNRLQMFSDINSDIKINVRVKAASGAGGLLDSLTATNAAAPDALPDLIALNRPDLENAALKSLIFQLDDLTNVPDDGDWYDFTREMALLQGSTFGLPFTGDSLVLVYKASNGEEISTSWEELFDTDSILAFPAESDQALFQMSLYKSAGGNLQDNQRRPILEVEPLTETLRLFQQGVETGRITKALFQYQTGAQVWTAYREGQTNLAVVWLSNYLKDPLAETTFFPLLPVNSDPVSFGTGMSWALAKPDENRHPIAVALAEFLVDPEFLAEYTVALGYLPPRPSSLENWPDQTLRPTIDQIAQMTWLQPSNDIIASLGPIIREGTRQVLQEMVDSSQAAQVAVESLED